MNAQHQIEHNIRVHDRMCRRYEWVHGEIFNPIEQNRIADTIRLAVARVRGASQPLRALDVGCGTGNLTRHLLAAGLRVTAADVSAGSLEYARTKFADAADRLETVTLNGRDLGALPDNSFELVAAYSLLHHVPDYLALVKEMARVLAPGGTLYIDHETARSFWSSNDVCRRYERLAQPSWYSIERWRKFLVPENYWFKLRRLRDPRVTAEGDLHVWEDDHIEWDRVEQVLEESGCVHRTYHEYLLYRRRFDTDLYLQYRSKCADVALLLASKS